MNKFCLVATSTLMVAVLGFAMACSDDEPSEEEARAALCSDLQQLGVSVDAFSQLSNQSTIGEMRAAKADVGDAVDEVKKSAEDVPDAQTAGLEQAYDDFNQTIENISDDQTAQQALDAVSASAQALATAHQQLVTDLACEAGTPTVPTSTEAATEAATEPATSEAATDTPAAGAETPTTDAPIETETAAPPEAVATPTS